jgi:ATP-dependent 26S proteasome regulatory subunit
MAGTEPLLERTLRRVLDEEVPRDVRLALLAELRRPRHDASPQIDSLLLDRLAAQANAISELHEVNDKLQTLARRLSEPPLREGRVLGFGTGPDGATLVRIASNGTERLLHHDFDEDDGPDLEVGDLVYLTQEGNAILGKALEGAEPGHCAPVARWLSGARLVVKDRNEEIVVRTSAALTPERVKPGDLVRLDRSSWMAMEAVEGGHAARYAPSAHASALQPEALAGYDDLRSRTLKRMTYAIAHRGMAEHFGVARDNDRILLEGPPGCGKTTLARVIAGVLHQATGKTCRITKINGAELYSPYVGETEQNIKRLMRELHATDETRSVLFLDEVDAIARMRGTSGNVHSDRFLNTLLAELEGFEGRARVVVVAATNRADMLDPAFRERFGWEIRMPRPRMAAARSIFTRHLAPDLPYRPNGPASAETRACIIEAAVSQLYSPNAACASIATLRLRDGKTRRVEAHELISGRLIEQICQDAREQAFQRAIEEGEHGITERDMCIAVSRAIERLRATLTVANIHGYLADLPQDVGVVSDEPVTRTTNPGVYLE